VETGISYGNLHQENTGNSGSSENGEGQSENGSNASENQASENESSGNESSGNESSGNESSGNAPSETEETELKPVLLDTDTVSTDEILLFSGAGIVMDADTGKVLYYKNPFTKLYPASLTKIMTTLVTLDHSTMDETVTVSQNAIDLTTWDSTRLGVHAGQEITMEEALYAVMVTSANDIANAVAEHVSGSISDFAALMNDYAWKLGCYHTHFVNPNGLHDDGHFTSAYDMAMISREALKRDHFAELCSASTYTYTSEITHTKEEIEILKRENDGEIGPYVLYSHHKMVNKTYPYEAAYGGKTGYTDLARNTLATFARKDGKNLICIVLDCPGGQDYIYADTALALDYCFNHYDFLSAETSLSAYNPDTPQIYTMAGDSPAALLPEYAGDIQMPVITPSSFNYANYVLYMKSMQDSPVSEDTLEKSFAQKAVSLIDFSEPDKKSKEEMIAGIAIIAICVVFLMLIIQQLVRIIRRRRRRMKYKKMKRQRLAQDAMEAARKASVPDSGTLPEDISLPDIPDVPDTSDISDTSDVPDTSDIPDISENITSGDLPEPAQNASGTGSSADSSQTDNAAPADTKDSGASDKPAKKPRRIRKITT